MMKDQKAVSKLIMVAIIVAILSLVVVGVVALMAIVANSTDTVNEANFYSYAQDLNVYTSAVQRSALTIRANCAMEGIIISDTQMYYMLAKGKTLTDVEADESLVHEEFPSGDGVIKVSEELKKVLDISYEGEVFAYEIETDTNVEGYTENISFYGNSNGKEAHYVTSNGVVFTLPGFPQTTDEGTQYYITPTLAYLGEPITDPASTAYRMKYVKELEYYTSAIKETAKQIGRAYAAKGIYLSDAQIYYIVARGKAIGDLELEETFVNSEIPSGDGATKVSEELRKVLKIPKRKDTFAYEIKTDTNVEGYTEDISFYGDANGKETHYVTSNGDVFTLPGLPKTIDGETKYYITPDFAYTGGPITDPASAAYKIEEDSPIVINFDNPTEDLLFSLYRGYFEDYASDTEKTELAIKGDCAEDGIYVNDAQMAYIMARGKTLSDVKEDETLMNSKIPSGDGAIKISGELKKVLGITETEDVFAYKIETDANVDGYVIDINFYGDANGKETHYITSNGIIFTLPGFLKKKIGFLRATDLTTDWIMEYYITPDFAYIGEPITDPASTEYRVEYTKELEYYISVVKATAEQIKHTYVTKGIYLSDAQIYYIIAKGKALEDLKDEKTFVNSEIPSGDDVIKISEELKKVLDIKETEDVFAYKMETDANLDSYVEAMNFYGDASDNETHYITSNGIIFTLPGFLKKKVGFPRATDWIMEYHITPDCAYIGDPDPITDPASTAYQVAE